MTEIWQHVLEFDCQVITVLLTDNKFQNSQEFDSQMKKQTFLVSNIYGYENESKQCIICKYTCSGIN